MPFLPQANTSALSYLEKRQEWVLSQIERLKEKVKELGEKFGLGPDEVGILQQQVIFAFIMLYVRTCPGYEGVWEGGNYCTDRQ